MRPAFAAAKLTKILAKFSLPLTSVFIVFVSITPTKIYFSSTPTLYESQHRRMLDALLVALTLVEK
jgi:hypothetical protein